MYPFHYVATKPRLASTKQVKNHCRFWLESKYIKIVYSKDHNGLSVWDVEGGKEGGGEGGDHRLLLGLGPPKSDGTL